jgi:hypothetical protein
MATRGRRRRGLSLLEVLVSMFVLLFHFGVAPLFCLGHPTSVAQRASDRRRARPGRIHRDLKKRFVAALRSGHSRWQPRIPHSDRQYPPPAPMRAQFDPLATVAASYILAVATLPGCFPNATPPPAAWHVFVRATICDRPPPNAICWPYKSHHSPSSEPRGYSGQYS